MNLLLLSFLASVSLFAQFNLGFVPTANALKFTQGSALSMPTVGGFDNPQFSEIKLDGDQYPDLFVFDRAHGDRKTFVFDPSTENYKYAPEYEKYFPDALQEFVLLRDYNCDGHADIFTYRSGSFAVYRNTGSTPPGFELITSRLMTQYGSITTGTYILPGDIPAIVDVDGDGDLDILTFGNASSENTIEYHQNQSMELFGTCDSLRMKVVTQCWGGIEEPANSSTLVEVTCKGIIPPGASRHHPGSSILAIDPDYDGDIDVALGDIETDHIVFAPNVGDANHAIIDVHQQTTFFPNAANPAVMPYLITGFEIDPELDGQRDLIFSVNNRIDSSCNAGHIWKYNNTGSASAVYTLETKEFLLGDMIDLGSQAVPVAMDVDGDGLQDLLVASSFRRTPTTKTGARLYYYRNIGTTIQPHFTLQNDNFSNWSSFQFIDPHPALGDLDGDGDLDMLVGVANGDLHLFTNTAPSGQPASFQLTHPVYKGINSIGQNAAPEIADLDGDGLLDILVGDKLGNVLYFRNTGTSTSAEFATFPTNDRLGKIDVSLFCCNGYAAPRVIDNSVGFGPGRFVFVGSSEKQIKIYRISQNLSDSFPLVDSIIIGTGRIAPLLADFNSDQITDLLVGCAEGGLRYYLRDKNYFVGLPTIQSSHTLKSKMAFPNPFQHELSVADTGLVVITDIQGREVLQMQCNESPCHLNTAFLPDGIYVLTLTSGTHRMLVIKE